MIVVFAMVEETFGILNFLNALEWYILNVNTFTIGEENFEIVPSWKSWNGLLCILTRSPWLKKILKLKLLECTRMALEVCRMMLNNFYKHRKTPPLSHEYVAPPASLIPKKYASHLPYAKKVRLSPPLWAVPPVLETAIIHKWLMRSILRYEQSLKSGVPFTL